MMERLQKVIAQSGVCSRRQAEALIIAGRVMVNGSAVTQLGSKVDPSQDSIKVDGKRLRLDQPRIYLLLNKPKGYICTLSDPEGRPKVGDLIRGVSQKLFPVGRLDYASEGLLLLTNDGEFTHLIASAGEHCPKTYLVKVRGNPTQDQLKKISRGFSLEGESIAPCHIQSFKEGENPWFNVKLTEGKNNQIRRMFDHIGHPVVKLRRIQIGFLQDPQLKPGAYRHLTPREVVRFKSLRK
jgi:23S rRNA pseudouridine2605 synthase